VAAFEPSSPATWRRAQSWASHPGLTRSCSPEGLRRRAGDSVLTVSLTAVATVAAIELAGAEPILVDIDPASFTIDCDHLESTILALRREGAAGKNVRAVVPVHLYGQPADLPGCSTSPAHTCG